MPTRKKKLKLISWNVNGIRAVLKKGFLDFVAESKPDVLCIQETKAAPDQVGLSLDGYRPYWNAAERKGYSGTLIFSKIEPLSVKNGLGVKKHDDEGRVITLEFEDYFLVTVYTPNSKRDLSRLEYRVEEWDTAFLRYLRTLEKTKPVVFCGDLNVSHKEIDLANPKSNRRNAGFTDEERGRFDKIVAAGFIDTFREFEPGGGHYSWWSYMGGARAKNIGWRLDYFCVSKSLRPRLEDAFILPDVPDSDHCPVGIILKA